MVHAAISWLSHPGSVGAELDLSKAFDLINWNVAKTAFCWAGAPAAIVNLIALGWHELFFRFGCMSFSFLDSDAFGFLKVILAHLVSLQTCYAPWHDLLRVHHLSPHVGIC